MSVRKISGSVTVDHRIYNPDNVGCLFWLFADENSRKGPSDEFLGGEIYVRVGSSSWLSNSKYTPQEFQEITGSAPQAIIVLRTDERGSLVRFRSVWYWADSDLDEDEIDAVLRARDIRKKQSVERAKNLAAIREVAPKRNQRRGNIPDEIKTLVWKRDGGECVKCGSSTELQFDHVIPVVLGGATTEQNLQVLCGPCNRTKGASVS
jgi:5-methylcytosine-specific restriction endonuclease McrA